MVWVAVGALYVAEALYRTFIAFFFTYISVIGGSSRLAFFYCFACIEQNAFKAVILSILLRCSAAVAFDNKVLVSHIIVVHIVPAESVHINLRYAFRNCYFFQVIAAEECRLADVLNALFNGKI